MYVCMCIYIYIYTYYYIVLGALLKKDNKTIQHKNKQEIVLGALLPRLGDVDAGVRMRCKQMII